MKKKTSNAVKPAPVPTPPPAPTFIGTAAESTSVEPNTAPQAAGTPIEHSLKEPVVTTPTLEQRQAMIPEEDLRMPDGSVPVTAKDFEVARGVDKHE